MNKYVFISSDGIPSYISSFADDRNIPTAPEGMSTVSVDISIPDEVFFNKYFDFDSKHFNELPIKPSEVHTWSSMKKEWVVTDDDFQKYKDMKREQISSTRNKLEIGGFKAFGKIFDSDSASQQRIAVAAFSAQYAPDDFTIEWTCADNSVVTLTKWQLVSLPSIMAQAGGQLHAKARLLKSQIDAAETIDEVNSVCW